MLEGSINCYCPLATFYSSLVWRPAAWAATGRLLKCKISGSTPDLLNQNLLFTIPQVLCIDITKDWEALCVFLSTVVRSAEIIFIFKICRFLMWTLLMLKLSDSVWLWNFVFTFSWTDKLKIFLGLGATSLQTVLKHAMPEVNVDSLILIFFKKWWYLNI